MTVVVVGSRNGRGQGLHRCRSYQLRPRMERERIERGNGREVVVVVKVASGGQNSLRGQIGLERVLRWKSRFHAWMRSGASGQAKLEQERCVVRLEAAQI